MIQEKYFEDVNVGDAVIELKKGPLQKLQLVMYAGASGDFNPLHTDDDFAKAVGMKDGVIAHGMFVMGCVGQAVTSWVPKNRLKRLGVRFAGMSKPGNTITISGVVTDKRVVDGENIVTCSVVAKDEQGDVKVSGSFDAALPSKA
ncbi:MAG: bifunctional enoyl-CoA hydratase/phosphate acetyltransferase [Deltaproteobacteria bacterium ADurb.BinA179]|jgi:acyl dehydratase|nr:dehydratase [Deltaproteobacteria bacterium]MDI9543390.1 MaoC/PaaZ C-terminal domain-containing protein [Pseudomonadota bacterium]NLW66686.1 dehydratase [Bacteriovoracaceae bacterium]OPZ24071.1 MAG: bifunctional enoyl-CoA hydratase/phosphate acetyltransferase [Deltaproteobacteria bacterium ADurb.BinA179]HRT46341.1 MaoC/PaaZ C-terminal domain-containing protein [Desulfomonilia bacterium]